jgi:2-methylcitrate dehydratase PrpD
MSATRELPVANTIAAFVEGALRRNYPEDTVDAAKKCLADWFGVALGACEEPAAKVMRASVKSSGSGDALLVSGGTAPPLFAALINGTTAHCLDFDDTHVDSLAHLSSPTWAATLAAASGTTGTGSDLLAAFIAGFETGAALGGQGRGEKITTRGLHSTAVFGRLAAAAAASAMLALDKNQVMNAMGVAATQAGGLTASFGTMAKPFHAGKAAMDGLLSAQLAGSGFVAAHDLLDRPAAFADVLMQHSDMKISADELGQVWQITQNTFKPYASCLMTHAAIDAARQVSKQLSVDKLEHASVEVHPLGLDVAGKTTVNTDLEGKFSLLYCIALALAGYPAAPVDFSAERRNNATVRTVMAHVHVQGNEKLQKTAASIVAHGKDGQEIRVDIPLALGNPGNPMTWDALEAKFMALAEPRLKGKAAELFATIRSFESVKDVRSIGAMLPA